jgi:hypothetical protein
MVLEVEDFGIIACMNFVSQPATMPFNQEM